MEDYNKTILLNPGFAEAYNNRGGLLNSMGNFAEAVFSFNKAIEIFPGFVIAYQKGFDCQVKGRQSFWILRWTDRVIGGIFEQFEKFSVFCLGFAAQGSCGGLL